MNTQENSSGKHRLYRIGYVSLAWLFVACIVVQIFIAGLAIFMDPIHWMQHTSFVHMIEFIPVLMLILAFLGKMPRSLRWWPVILFLLISLQYMTAEALGGPLVAALHPVIAMLIFYAAFTVAQKAVRTIRKS